MQPDSLKTYYSLGIALYSGLGRAEEAAAVLGRGGSPRFGVGAGLSAFGSGLYGPQSQRQGHSVSQARCGIGP